MEEKRGYIKLWRSFIDTNLFKKGTHTELKLYILLILKAHWSDYQEALYGKTITLHAGEVLTTINELVNDLGTDSSTMKVRYALAKLEEKGEIKITTIRKRTIISIQNWRDKYATNLALTTGLTSRITTGITIETTASSSMEKPMKSSEVTDCDKSFNNKFNKEFNNEFDNKSHEYNKYYSLLQEDIQEDIQEDLQENSSNKEIYNDSANKDYIGEKQQQKSPPKKKRTVFVKPTLEEVKAYIKEKGYTFDPEAFMDYYEANGWKVGKNQMKSWKATCNNWERNQNRFKKKNESGQIAVGRFGADYHLNL